MNSHLTRLFEALGVAQTAAFFLNDQPVEPTSFEQLERLLIDALQE